MNTGKVKLYKKDEGYGVIAPDDGSRIFSFAKSAVLASSYWRRGVA
jgi:cold shock CspA family protein